jgi:hypothetical protein
VTPPDGTGYSFADGDDVVGRPGIVTIAIPGGEEPGEVRVALAGGVLEHFVAWSADHLDVGAGALVVAWRGRRRVDVEPWLL